MINAFGYGSFEFLQQLKSYSLKKATVVDSPSHHFKS